MLKMVEVWGWRQAGEFYVPSKSMSYYDFAMNITWMIGIIAESLLVSVKAGHALWRMDCDDMDCDMRVALPLYPDTRAGRRAAELYARSGMVLSMKLRVRAMVESAYGGCDVIVDQLVARYGRDDVATAELLLSTGE